MGVSVSRRDATPCALLQKEASQRQQRRSVAPASQRRSANSVAASLPRRSVAPASQRQQRRSVTPASQRRSANSVAASLAQRQRRSVAASQRHPPPGASQRRSATRPRERHSATSETHASAPFAPALIPLFHLLHSVTATCMAPVYFSFSVFMPAFWL